MSHLISSFLFVVLIFVSLPAHADETWSKRCQDEAEQQCEIFQRLVIEEDGSRFAEMAVGKAEGSDGEDQFQSMVILPLGMLIPHAIAITIADDELGQALPQFCVAEGCMLALNLSQDDLLNRLRRGGEIVFAFKAPNGDDLSATFTLKGFTRALRGID